MAGCLWIAEEDDVACSESFGGSHGAEGERPAGREFETELVGETAHGPTGVDFADTVPFQPAGGAMEEGIHTHGAEVVGVFEEFGERCGEIQFYLR